MTRRTCLVSQMLGDITKAICTTVLMALFVALAPHTALCGDSKVVHLTILHLNDVYEMEPVDNGHRGGLARVATLRKQVLAESPYTLLVLAGDTLSPSIASSLSKGAHAI